MKAKTTKGKKPMDDRGLAVLVLERCASKCAELCGRATALAMMVRGDKPVGKWEELRNAASNRLDINRAGTDAANIERGLLFAASLLK